MLSRALVLVLVVAFTACTPSPATVAPSPTVAPTSPSSPSPPVSPTGSPRPIAALIDQISSDRLFAHVTALAGYESRDPRHPGHAKAIAYLQDQLGALPGVRVDLQRFVYQGIPMTNVLATIDPPSGPPADGWILLLAHYDSIAKASPGWRPAIDPAPGADDNGTGTAALLEHARILSSERGRLKQRVVVAFVDGEELFFKGSAAYLQIQPRPIPFAAALNVDFVGSNPLVDRLDLIWYTQVSATLRDRVIAANQRYAIEVTPLIPSYATDPNVTIMDIAPWGLAGVPSVAVSERYPPVPDAQYPGNPYVHTVDDTPQNLTNRTLWLKAAKLMLAVTLELAGVN